MNSLNDIVIANALNRSLSNLTEATVALGRVPFTVEKHYNRAAEMLQKIYTRNSFLQSIEPKTLFQIQPTVGHDISAMREALHSPSNKSAQHADSISGEIAQHVYSYEPIEEVSSLIDDLDNVYMDILNEMSEPEAEYDIAYHMRYTTGGALMINNYVITQPRLDKPVDKALQAAFMQPNTVVEAKGNLSKFKHDIELPNPLKDMLFRVSKNSIMVTPYITQAMLDEYGITRLEIDKSLSKFMSVK